MVTFQLQRLSLLLTAISIVCCIQGSVAKEPQTKTDAQPRDVFDKLHFAFTMTRHGARAPTDTGDGYKVEGGMLTASGMRQRFLLGTYNRARYVDLYGLLDADETIGASQVYMESTNVNRTMQSGYSELMGLFPPQNSKIQPKNALNPKQIEHLKNQQSNLFNVRDLDKINTELGEKPLPYNFEAISVRNHDEISMGDDLDMEGCSYVQRVDGYRFPAESTYWPVEFLKDDLRKPIGDCFNLTERKRDHMSFIDLYGYCDQVQSAEFEGLDLGCDFSEQDLKHINETVLSTLVLPLSEPILSRELYSSKFLRRPIHLMDRIVHPEKYSENQKMSNIKLMSYSTHDWTLATMLLFLRANNGKFSNLPFASNIAFELHSSEDCTSDDCFWVEIIYNGKQLRFKERCLDPVRCTYPEFLLMLTSRDFVKTESRYFDECAKVWNPPEDEVHHQNGGRFLSENDSENWWTAPERSPRMRF